MHMPVGSGSLQVPAMLANSCEATSGVQTVIPIQATNAKDVFTFPASDTQSTATASSSLGGSAGNLTMGPASLASDLLPQLPVMMPIKRGQIPDPQSLDAQRQICLQQIEDNLAYSIKALCEMNATQRELLKRQSEHMKQAYMIKIDHEVMAEEVNLDREANHELLQLQQIAADYKRVLEQQACAATYEYEKQRSADLLQEDLCSSSEATLMQPPVPRLSLIAAYRNLVTLPSSFESAMAALPVSAVESDNSTTLAASPVMSPASSFVPWPEQAMLSPVPSYMYPATDADLMVNTMQPEFQDCVYNSAIPSPPAQVLCGPSC